MDDREARKKERESLLAKVRALLAKTVENGATEAEAIAAAAKAAELMAKHDLSMDELDVKESVTEAHDHELDPMLRAHMSSVCLAIAELCGTRYWVHGRGTLISRGTFFGLKHDVEISGYLFDICEGAMRREVARREREFGLYRARVREARIDSFLAGMADRLYARIMEMARERKGTKGALVPVKDATLDQAMKDEGIKLKETRLGLRDRDKDRFKEGKAVGNRVSLASGVGRSRTSGAIG